MTAATITEITMPRLSDSMEEGTIVRWLRAGGDTVVAGEPVVEIETDKATMEYEAEAGGVLEIVVGEGATVALGETIARLLPDGVEVAPSRPSRILATPVARRIAAERGLDLAAVAPSGRRGQIMKADVEAHAPHRVQPDVRVNGDAPPDSAPPAATRIEASRLQRTVARRMAQSRATVPDFEVSVDIDMAAALALRSELAAHLDPVPSVNDMIVRACALALREHPRVNGVWREDGFDLLQAVNVGVAVAAEDALLVAVVPDTDRASLAEIARATRRLAARARSGEIGRGDLSGATFTVSNLGMFGVERFTAIIDAPQAAILAVGAITQRPVVRDGAIAPGSIMTATLAADHRILYGADAARFITDVRDRLQAPLGLLV